MITLCTLFNTNYIDKGLTMYESIERYTQDYVLYVLCMDDRCFEILTDLNRPRFIPIKLSDFESPELLAVKPERSIGEYCWTCSSCLVDYVMRTFNPEYCAYIDSDLYFYDDVNVVVKEMQERNASVMITGHRFNWYDRKEMEWRVGKYCVEFNTFRNDEKGRSLLAIWKHQCLEYCKIDGDGVHWADQKYLDNWCDDYDFCVETKNLGAGIAPWNVSQYKMVSKDEYGPSMVECKGKRYRPLFYHFQNLNYINENTANSHIGGYWGVDFDLVRTTYIPYMVHININKSILNKQFGVEVLLKKHPGVLNVKKRTFSSTLKKVFKFNLIVRKITNFLLHKLPHYLNGTKEVMRVI